MHIHILGIAGTFMGGIAALAKAFGYKVTGCDHAVYPPMSDQLATLGIECIEGFDAQQTELNPDVFVIGNAVTRGNPLVEAILNQGLPYTSGPAWLAQHVLQDRWVLAVAGTHGKTTTTAMLVHILRSAGLNPGYLIGGVAKGLSATAMLGETPFFVIEADEYDTAFFDKRSKFVHYRPRTLIINNLEFDHADIFADLKAIQTQFHHVVRTVPALGLIVSFTGAPNVEAVLQQGCWTPRVEIRPQQRVSPEVGVEPLYYRLLAEDGHSFALGDTDAEYQVNWSHTGLHNVANGMAALAAARHAGVPLHIGAEALGQFQGVKRRMELVASGGGCYLYDDFAHHPTAIKTTLEGLRASLVKNAPEGFRIWCVIEPRSNTMKSGVHAQALSRAFAAADQVLFFLPEGLDWQLDHSHAHLRCISSADTVSSILQSEIQPGDHIVLMSNGAFVGVRDVLPELLGLERFI